MLAMQGYKQSSGRMFPTWYEVLAGHVGRAVPPTVTALESGLMNLTRVS